MPSILDGITKRLRPGSSGQATSRVDTSGARLTQQAAEARLRSGGGIDPTSQNWPVALGPKPRAEQNSAEAEAQPYPFYAPDDSKMLKRIFNLDVPEI